MTVATCVAALLLVLVAAGHAYVARRALLAWMVARALAVEPDPADPPASRLAPLRWGSCMRGRHNRNRHLHPRRLIAPNEWRTAPAWQLAPRARTRWGRLAEGAAAALLVVALAIGWLGERAGAPLRAAQAPTAVQPVNAPTPVVSVEVGSFAKQSATGNQDVTIATNGTGFASGTWAIIFWTSGSDQASGTFDACAQSMVGFVANGGGTIGEYAAAAWSEDAVTPNSSRRQAEKCICMPDSTGTTVVYDANWVAFQTSSTMRLNWTTNSSAGSVFPNSTFNYMIISGLTGAKVTSQSISSGAGNKSCTGAGFTPDLIFLTHTEDAVNSSAVDAHFGFGVVNKAGQQWGNSWCDDDAPAGNSVDSRYQHTDLCLAGTSLNESIVTELQFNGMTSDGCTLYAHTKSFTSVVGMLYLGGVSSKIGAFSRITGTGAQTVLTRHGFTPRGLLLGSFGSPAAVAGLDNALWELGATDGTNSRSAAIVSVDNQATSNADSVWSSTNLYGRGQASAGAQSYAYRGTYTSWDSTSFTINQAVADGSAGEMLYLLLGDAAQPTFHRQVTLPSTSPQTYSNQKRTVTLASGRMVLLTIESSAATVWWSDDGITWTDYSANVGGFAEGSCDVYTDSGGTQRLVIVWTQTGTSGTGPTGGARTAGRIYVATGAFNGGETTLTWGAAYDTNPCQGTASRFCDVVAHAEGTGGIAHVVESVGNASYLYTFHMKLTINSSGTFTACSGTNIGGDYGTASADSYPSISMNPSDKRLHCAWTTGDGGSAGKGLRYKTASYSAGSWTWGSEVEIDNTRYVEGGGNQARWLQCRWDPAISKVIVALYGTNGTNSHLLLYESANFTSFGTAVVDHASGDRFAGGGIVITATSDIYVFGFANSPAPFDLIYRKYTRATATWDSTSTWLDTDAGGTLWCYPWFSNGVIRWTYPRGHNGPFPLVYDQLIDTSAQSHQLVTAA